MDRLFGDSQSIVHLDRAVSTVTSSVCNGAWPQIKIQAHEKGKNDPKAAILSSAFVPKSLCIPAKAGPRNLPVCRKHGSPTCLPNCLCCPALLQDIRLGRDLDVRRKDYICRTTPQNAQQSLSNADVYAVSALSSI
jgi:hypothetical protein